MTTDPEISDRMELLYKDFTIYYVEVLQLLHRLWTASVLAPVKEK